MKSTVSVSIDLALEPPEAFDAVVDEISLALQPARTVASGIVGTSDQSEEEKHQQNQRGLARAPLVQRLLDAPNLPAFITDLITTQATTVVGTEAAGFLIEKNQDGATLRLLAHIRPDKSTKEVREAAIKAFLDLITPCVQKGKDGAIEIGPPGDVYHPETQYCLVTLLRSDGKPVAVSAVITRCMNLDRAKQRLQSMQLAAGYFELLTLRHKAEQIKVIAQSHQQVGVTFETRPLGRVLDGKREVGQVVVWELGKMFVLRWNPPKWNPKETIEVEFRFEPIDAGTHVTVELRGWSAVAGGAHDVVGWFAGEVAAPLVRATLPERLADWLTDRRARRPSGAAARGVYRDPLYHYPNFKVILAELKLTRDDYLIEIGCGGGAMLKEALKSGCRAAAVDHSLDMVRLARNVNADAVAAGRLVVEHASADRLPFRDATFTRGAMTGVLGFLPDAVAALRELWRVLRPGGRLVILGSDPALRGTPAAPEPIASRLHFYNDEQFRQLALDAGFAEASVVRRDLLPYAREAGVPEEHLPLFAKQPAPFLIARKA